MRLRHAQRVVGALLLACAVGIAVAGHLHGREPPPPPPPTPPTLARAAPLPRLVPAAELRDGSGPLPWRAWTDWDAFPPCAADKDTDTKKANKPPGALKWTLGGAPAQVREDAADGWCADLPPVPPAPASPGECRARAELGHNVVLERLLRHANATPPGQAPPILCDVVGPSHGPKSGRWSEAADVVADADAPLDWRALSARLAREPAFASHARAVVIHFPRGKSFCTALDLPPPRDFPFPLVLVGPFGDGQNFGPFSGGPLCPSCDEPLDLGGCGGQFERWWCGRGAWSKLVDFLEDPRVWLWVTFAQTVDHPKLVSVPLGVETNFWRAAASRAGLELSLRTPKSALVGATFALSGRGSNGGAQYGHRAALGATLERSPRLRGRAVHSRANPWALGVKENATARARATREAMHVFRSARLVLAPHGFGVDTKRPVEALLTGGVPVVLRTSGLWRTYAGLPVVWVEAMDDAAAWDARYLDAACAAKEPRWDRLTWTGWVRFVRGVAEGRIVVGEWAG